MSYPTEKTVFSFSARSAVSMHGAKKRLIYVHIVNFRKMLSYIDKNRLFPVDIFNQIVYNAL